MWAIEIDKGVVPNECRSKEMVHSLIKRRLDFLKRMVYKYLLKVCVGTDPLSWGRGGSGLVSALSPAGEI